MAPMMGIPQEAVAAMVDNQSFSDKSKQVLDLFHDHVSRQHMHAAPES